MIKIGILSLPLNWNYGGILQQYALSEYLRKKNFTPILFEKSKTTPRAVVTFADDFRIGKKLKTP